MFEYVVRKGGLKESEARWFFQQLIIGVDYLHRMVQCQSTHAKKHYDVLHNANPSCKQVLKGCVCKTEAYAFWVLAQLCSTRLRASPLSRISACRE